MYTNKVYESKHPRIFQYNIVEFQWIKIGIRENNWTLVLPPCSASGAAFSSEYFTDGSRNADGVFRGTEVGRTIDKQNISFDIILSEKWWEIQNWFENNGKTFFAEYMNYRLGTKMVRKFYLGNVSQEPHIIDPITGKPQFMKNCTMNIIDVGE